MLTPHDPRSDRAETCPGSLPFFLAGFLLAAAAWLWLMKSVFVVQPGDEGIYLYDSFLASRGDLPYRDFFLAHPPLRILAGAGLFSLGLPAVVVKSLAPLALVGAALLAGLTILRQPGGRPAWAVLASVFLLFASQSIQACGSWVGVETAAILVAAAAYALSRRRFAVAGLLLALASWQALYAVLPVPVLAIWAWRERGLRPFLAGLAAGPVLHGLTWAACGNAYVEQVFLYHLHKVGTDTFADPVERLLVFVYGDVGLLAFALAGLLHRDRVSRWSAIAGLSCVAVVAAYSSLMTFYFIVAFPLLAVASACGLRHLSGLVRNRWVGAVAVFAAVAVTYLPHVSGALGLGEIREREAVEVEAFVARVDRCRPDSGRIWGTGSLVPMLALRTGLAVAGGEVDTDDKRFTSGASDIGTVMDRALSEPAPLVILALDHGLDLVPGARERLAATWVPIHAFDLQAAGYRGLILAPPAEADRSRGCLQEAGGPSPSSSRRDDGL